MLYIGRGVRACVGASAQRASGPQDVPRRGGGAVDVQEGEGGSKRAERGAAVVHREAQSQQEYHNVGSPRRDAMRCAQLPRAAPLLVRPVKCSTHSPRRAEESKQARLRASDARRDRNRPAHPGPRPFPGAGRT